MKKGISTGFKVLITMLVVSGLAVSYAQLQKIGGTKEGSTIKSFDTSSGLKQIDASKVQQVENDPVEIKVNIDQFPDGTPCVPNSYKALEPGKDFSPKIENKAVVAKAMEIVENIYKCQKFDFSKKDGTIFGNREGRLPKQSDTKYYREYTLVPSDRKPGDGTKEIIIGGKKYTVTAFLGQRGSERIIVGGFEEIYYTPDHYGTFIKLTINK